MFLSVVSRFFYGLFLLLMAIQLQANPATEEQMPSFKCSTEAKVYAERLICNDETLANIDLMQEEMYEKLVQNLHEKGDEKLREEQLLWEQTRNEQCRNTYDCLLAYAEHFISLKRQVDALAISEKTLIDFIQRQLEQTIHSYEQRSEYPTLDTELPKQGLRGFYVNTTLTLEILERLSGISVYKEGGPHKAGRWNFDATENFGHYNPEFITWVKTKVLVASRQTPLRLPSQRLYNDYLRTTARTFYLVYQYLYAIEQQTHVGVILDNYQTRLADKTLKPGGEKNYPYCEFQSLGEHFKRLGYSPDEAKVAAAFWLRRFLDGTDEIFFEALETLFQYFDTKFLEANRKDDDIVRFYDQEKTEAKIKAEQKETVNGAQNQKPESKADDSDDTEGDVQAPSDVEKKI